MSAAGPCLTLPPRQVTIGCDSLSLAGDLVQDLAEWLALQQLEVQADFPREFDALGKLLAQASTPWGAWRDAGLRGGVGDGMWMVALHLAAGTCT